MKPILLVTVMLLVVAAAPSAQGRRGGGRSGGARGPMVMDEQGTLLLWSALLDLTDAQQQQLRTIFDDAAKTGAPIAAQNANSSTALFQAAKAGQSADAIKALADQQGARTSEMLVLQAQTFSKAWALLTDDQKSKVDATIFGNIGEFLAMPRPSMTMPLAPVGVPSGAGPAN